MPADAVKAEVPPSDLTDRNEGWGVFGMIYDYPEYKDDGVWPDTPQRQNEFEKYPSETTDRDWSLPD